MFIQLFKMRREPQTIKYIEDFERKLSQRLLAQLVQQDEHDFIKFLQTAY